MSLPTVEQKITLLKKYFEFVTPLSQVILDNDQKVGGVHFFKVANKDKKKIVGLTEELVHWLINQSDANKDLEEQTLGMYSDLFHEPDDVQIFLTSDPKICKWYKALAYYEFIRQ